MKIRYIILSVITLIASLSVSAKVRYVFYFIGDGMGMGHVNTTQYYNRMVLGNDTPLLMMQFPIASQAQTYSASAPITDSAAAGTALSTGSKTRNYTIGLAPDTITPLISIARKLKDDGWGVAVLSSCAADDATPAAFYAHQVDRNMFYEINLDAAASGYDFLGGASLRGVRKPEQAKEVYSALKKAGYAITHNPDSVTLLGSDRVMLLADPDKRGNDNSIGYTVDSLQGAMTVAQMTQAALNHLMKQSPDQFFMMVEDGEIDHASHANDAGAAIKDILSFQDAIKVAYDFYKQHPDETLIIVTADHDTGGMAIGSRTNRVNLNLIDSQRISKDKFSDYCRSLIRNNESMSWDEMKKFLSDKLGFWTTVPITENETKDLQVLFDKAIVARESQDQRTLYNNFNQFAVKVFDLFNSHVGTSFISGNHTANPVPVFAIGAGADNFKKALNNIEIPLLIYDLTR